MNPTPSMTIAAKTGCGNLYVTTHGLSVTATLGKAGGCAACQLGGHSRLASLALRHGATMAEVAEGLRGLSCHQSGPTAPSCVSALGDVLHGLAGE